MRRIPLAAIQIDPAIQQRVSGTSQAVVDEYASAMRDGDAFPQPIVFSRDGVTYYLGDGFHRVEAYRLAHPDVQEIECEVHRGDHDDALEYACGANAFHGLPRNILDKHKSILTLLRSEKWAQRSDREIARQCKVSHPLAAKVRREHLKTDSRCRAKVEDGPEHQVRDANVNETAGSTGARRRIVTRRGKSYPMRTARIGGARATPSRPKNAEAKPLLSSLSWSIAPKSDRVKFVSAVGGREIVETLKSIEPGFSILNWAWKGATQAERQTFAEEHHKEISGLAKALGPTGAAEPSPNPTPADGLRELKPDDDPLAIPTILRRAKVPSRDPVSDQVGDAAMSDIA